MASKRRVLVAAVLISAVLTCASLFALLFWVTPSVLDVECAIADTRYARDIHQWYIDNNYYGESTGSMKWHEEWVTSYNDTIVVLESYKSLLLRLGKTTNFLEDAVK